MRQRMRDVAKKNVASSSEVQQVLTSTKRKREDNDLDQMEIEDI